MTKKLNARNSATLGSIKSIFNQKIYKQALNIANTQGEKAAQDYVLTFVNDEGREACRAKWFPYSVSDTNAEPKFKQGDTVRAKAGTLFAGSTGEVIRYANPMGYDNEVRNIKDNGGALTVCVLLRDVEAPKYPCKFWIAERDLEPTGLGDDISWIGRINEQYGDK